MRVSLCCNSLPIGTFFHIFFQLFFSNIASIDQQFAGTNQHQLPLEMVLELEPDTSDHSTILEISILFVIVSISELNQYIRRWIETISWSFIQ